MVWTRKENANEKGLDLGKGGHICLETPSHPHTRNIILILKQRGFDLSLFADDTSIIRSSGETAMEKEIIEEAMGNFEEQTNKSKEEHVIFGDLESGRNLVRP